MTGNVLSVDKNSYSCFEFNFNYKRSKCLTFNKSCLPVLITICVLLSALNRNASIVSFTFGVFNLVFWLLTYCQCPFPCDQYQGKHSLVCSPECATPSSCPGMCESKVTVKYLHCRDKVLVWVWPTLSFIGLVRNKEHNTILQSAD